MSIRKKYIQQTVNRLLIEQQVSVPPVKVAEIAERLGIRISKQKVDDDVSGFLLMASDQKTPVIGVNTNHNINRQRFTVAHELGHFLLHKGNRLHVDRTLKFEIRLRDAESSKGLDLDEREANAFAAELLMPQEFLERDLAGVTKLDDKMLTTLADRYQVSRDAFTFRLANLRYIRM